MNTIHTNRVTSQNRTMVLVAALVVFIFGLASEASSQTVITNRAYSDSTNQSDNQEYELDASNDTSEVSITATPLSDLEVFKDTVYQSSIRNGFNFQYRLIVRNNGVSSDPAVIVTDDLDEAFLEFVSFGSATQGTADYGTTTPGVITWDVGVQGVGQADTLYFTVKAIASGSVTNIATGTCDNTDTIPDNNHDTITVTIDPVVDIDVAKSVTGASGTEAAGGTLNVYEGETITYTIVITNNGPDDATGNIVRDFLPDGVTIVASSASATPSTGATVNSFNEFAAGTDMDGAGDNPNGAVKLNSDIPVGESVTITVEATVDAN